MAALAARRLAVRSLRALASPAPFSTSAAASKAPSISDIGANSVDQFEDRQKQFRETLAARQKSKSADKPANFFHDPTHSSHGPIVSEATHQLAQETSAAAANALHAQSPPKALGSLSSANVGERQQQAPRPDTKPEQQQSSSSGAKLTGLSALSSIIYGTEEGRQLDRDIERSYSQVLARGKYVHSITFHRVEPDKVDDYTKLVGDWYPKIAADPKNEVHLVGSWRTEVGDCDTFVHIWEYKKYSGFHTSLYNIKHHADYAAKEAQLKQLIDSKDVSLMQEFSFWPTTPPRQLGGIFELRSYTLHPGNLLEWETHWRKGLQARKEVMEGVGAWFVQVGELNTVHHLWQFADLEERRKRRELSWAVEGWSDTVHKTVPLIQTMKSRILVPCAWSPVG